jgi:hypothetical protein
VNHRMMTLTTKIWSESALTPHMGKIVAARGDPSGEDRWEVVVLYDNPVLPFNYNFDFDDTSFTIL